MPSSGRVEADGTCRAWAAMQGTVPTIDSENRGFSIFLPPLAWACESRLVVRRVGRCSQGRVIALSITPVADCKSTPAYGYHRYTILILLCAAGQETCWGPAAVTNVTQAALAPGEQAKIATLYTFIRKWPVHLSFD